MKQKFVYILCLLCSVQAAGFCQTKDILSRVNSAQEIDSVLVTVNPRYKYFKAIPAEKYHGWDCKQMADSMHIQPWTKIDLDRNGLTDLLVHGSWQSSPHTICLMDFGKNHFEIYTTTRGMGAGCGLTRPGKIGKQNVLYYYWKPKFRRQNDRDTFYVDTLTYRFGELVEYHKKAARHHIEKIEYEASPCFGDCPYFRMTIHADRSALFNPVTDNKLKLGKYTAVIDKQHFAQLIDLLNYIDFEKLKNHYSAGWTDDTTGTLKITYDGGKVKQISDYAMQGTFGLSRVHRLISQLCDNQDWK